jgi:hypothetical protein
MFALRTAKTTGAAVVAFVVAKVITSGSAPLLAPLTALLVVQITTWSTLRSSFDRVASVIAGVLLAVGFSEVAGLSWWSLGTLIFLSLVVGRLMRLGDNLLEVPISAMLVLGVYDPSVAAWGRVQETLIGAGVGVIASIVVPPPIYSAPAAEALRRLADGLAQLLDGAGRDLLEGWSQDRNRKVMDDLQALRRDVIEVERAVDRLEESLRLNPRGSRVSEAPASLRTALTIVELALVSLPAVFRALDEGMTRQDEAPAFGNDVRTALSETLLRCGEAVGVFGHFTAADVTAPTSDEERLADAVSRARRAQEELGAAMLADPHSDLRVFGLRGSLMLAVERVLDAVDIERTQEAIGVRRAGRTPVMRQLLASDEAARTAARQQLRRNVRPSRR